MKRIREQKKREKKEEKARRKLERDEAKRLGTFHDVDPRDRGYGESSLDVPPPSP